jgi:hypothetical protein
MQLNVTWRFFDDRTQTRPRRGCAIPVRASSMLLVAACTLTAPAHQDRRVPGKESHHTFHSSQPLTIPKTSCHCASTTHNHSLWPTALTHRSPRSRSRPTPIPAPNRRSEPSTPNGKRVGGAPRASPRSLSRRVSDTARFSLLAPPAARDEGGKRTKRSVGSSRADCCPSRWSPSARCLLPSCPSRPRHDERLTDRDRSVHRRGERACVRRRATISRRSETGNAQHSPPMVEFTVLW